MHHVLLRIHAPEGAARSPDLPGRALHHLGRPDRYVDEEIGGVRRLARSGIVRRDGDIAPRRRRDRRRGEPRAAQPNLDPTRVLAQDRVVLKVETDRVVLGDDRGMFRCTKCS